MNSTNPKRRELLRLVEFAMGDPAKMEQAFRRLETLANDCNEAMEFNLQRPPGSLLGLPQGKRLDRRGITLLISERAERDPAFRAEFLAQPRFFSTLAAKEGLGIKPVDYLWQVQEVRTVEEEPGLHWLILPECHRGCGTLEAQASAPMTASCHVCGAPREGACVRMTTNVQPAKDLIHEIDEFIIREAQSSSSFRARLTGEPTHCFGRVADEHFGTNLANLGIRQVKVEADTDTMLYTVLLARHEPFRVPVDDQWREDQRGEDQREQAQIPACHPNEFGVAFVTAAESSRRLPPQHCPPLAGP